MLKDQDVREIERINLQYRFKNEIVYNNIHLNSGKAELLTKDEFMMGMTIAILSLFTIWVIFKKFKESLFSYETFQDFFESQ